MADISSVDTTTIKDLYEALESLTCMTPVLLFCCMLSHMLTCRLAARIMTRILY